MAKTSVNVFLDSNAKKESVCRGQILPVEESLLTPESVSAVGGVSSIRLRSSVKKKMLGRETGVCICPGRFSHNLDKCYVLRCNHRRR